MKYSYYEIDNPTGDLNAFFQLDDQCPTSPVWRCDLDGQKLTVFNQNTGSAYEYVVVNNFVVEYDENQQVLNSWQLTSFLQNLDSSPETLKVASSTQPLETSAIQTVPSESIERELVLRSFSTESEAFSVLGICLSIPLLLLLLKQIPKMIRPSLKKPTTSTSLSAPAKYSPLWFQNLTQASRKDHEKWLAGSGQRTIEYILDEFLKSSAVTGLSAQDIMDLSKGAHPKQAAITQNTYDSAVAAAKRASIAALSGDTEASRQAIKESVSELIDYANHVKRLTRGY